MTIRIDDRVLRNDGIRLDNDALRELAAKRLFATDPRILSIIKDRAEGRDPAGFLEQAWLYAMCSPLSSVERAARKEAEDRAGEMFPVGAINS